MAHQLSGPLVKWPISWVANLLGGPISWVALLVGWPISWVANHPPQGCSRDRCFIHGTLSESEFKK